MRRQLLLATTVLAGLTGGAEATTYRIAPNGNDTTGAGTAANPWRSWCRAQSVLQPGDVLEAAGGTYLLSASGGCSGTDWNVSGTATARITFRNVAGQTPVFDGEHDATAFIIFDGSLHDVEILGLKIQHWELAGNGGGAVMVFDSAHDITITGNHFFENGTEEENQHHIYLQNSIDDIVIRRNIFEVSAGGGVHTFHGPGPTDVNIVNNFFKGNLYGVISADGASRYNIHNNTFLNNGKYLNGPCIAASLSFFDHGTIGIGAHSLRNNIVRHTNGCPTLGVGSRDASAIDEDYDVIYSTTTSQSIEWTGNDWSVTQLRNNTTNADHSQQNNPTFVNAPTSDELTATSPGVNDGVALGTVATDRLGVARPINAYDVGSRER